MAGPFQSNVVYDASTVANFKSWSENFLAANLSAMGWTKTSDNGQVDWTKVLTTSHLPSSIQRPGFGSYNFRGAWVAPTSTTDTYLGTITDGSNHGNDVVTYTDGVTYQALGDTKVNASNIARVNVGTALTLTLSSLAMSGTQMTLNGLAGGSGGLGITSRAIGAITVTSSSGGAGTGYMTVQITGVTGIGAATNGLLGYMFTTTTTTNGNNSIAQSPCTASSESGGNSFITLLNGSAVAQPGAAGNIITDFAGYVFLVAGFNNPGNNGYFCCTSSTSTTLVFSSGQPGGANYAGTNETIAATAAMSTSLMSIFGNGVFTNGGNGTVQPGFNNPTTSLNNWQGLTFTLTGFSNAANNGTFTCLFSCSSTLCLLNASAVPAGAYTGGSAQTGNALLVSPPATTVSGTVTGVATNGSNITTVTCTNTFVAGMKVWFAGLNGGADATFLNGTIITTYTILTATSSQFTIATTGHTSTTPTVTTGTATVQGSTYNENNLAFYFWQPYHYEVWQTNDGFTPVYLRINYGAQASSATDIHPVVVFQMGYTTNGNGWVIGNMVNGQASASVASESYMFGNIANANPSQTFECGMCGTGTSAAGAWLTIYMWRTTSTLAQCFTFERSLNSSGAAVDSFFTVAQTGHTLQLQQSVSKPGNGSQGNQFTGSLCYPIQPNSVSLAYNGLNVLLPVFPSLGYLGNPMTVIGIVSAADTIDGSLVNGAIYGTTHTYMVQRNAGTSIITSNAGFSAAVRFEAA